VLVFIGGPQKVIPSANGITWRRVAQAEIGETRISAIFSSVGRLALLSVSTWYRGYNYMNQPIRQARGGGVIPYSAARARALVSGAD
jgi:hypothetical protein